MGKAETGKEVVMNGTIHKLAERESVLLQAYREELVERIRRVISSDGTVQPLQGLHLYHNSVPMARVYGVVEPSLCVVAQGSKEFLLGESHYRYDPLHLQMEDKFGRRRPMFLPIYHGQTCCRISIERLAMRKGSLICVPSLRRLCFLGASFK